MPIRGRASSVNLLASILHTVRVICNNKPYPSHSFLQFQGKTNIAESRNRGDEGGLMCYRLLAVQLNCQPSFPSTRCLYCTALPSPVRKQRSIPFLVGGGGKDSLIPSPSVLKLASNYACICGLRMFYEANCAGINSEPLLGGRLSLPLANLRISQYRHAFFCDVDRCFSISSFSFLFRSFFHSFQVLGPIAFLSFALFRFKTADLADFGLRLWNMLHSARSDHARLWRFPRLSQCKFDTNM